ncbi:CDGSH iron-sulfur domain-containing protein [[Limnothrix rosea] IAM M-220]|uniref:CDGSH iron-sulfur domain-containing protein n=1 Tax=[Limnothrix rosea] IAM M-220 TaxID=454133 RepID=UPI000961ED23|nr:CDGSH iron-sulfur domain-containing protein [[Limnothrix rosea] IAM M-220]OKH16896.1 cytochrome C551 [[Limnothrix rosea] IAM M-220]
MPTPKIADTKPMVMELEAGDYFWCTCGHSANQPFCDGGHQGTDFAPQKFTLEEKQKVAMCLCKHSQNPPFCDGSHAKL